MNLNKYCEQVVGYQTIINWINTTLKNYLRKNEERVGEIEHILDYLKSDKAPRNIKGLQYEHAKRNSERWTKTLVKQGRNIVETEDDIETVLDLDDGFKLVRLLTESAYKREGSLMSHCVSSYFNRTCRIYSLRDSNNMPHCTIEVSGNSWDQIQGKGNGSIHPKYVKYVVHCLKHFKVDVTSRYIEKLGYSKIAGEMLELLKNNFKNVKWMSWNGDLFLYNHMTSLKRK